MFKVMLVVAFCLFPFVVQASPSDFALRLCKEQPQIYKCVKIKVKSTKRPYYEWNELFPNKLEMRVLVKINRRNTLIWNGHTIAVPRVFDLDSLAYSPFPKQKSWKRSKHLIVDLKQLAWAAYEPIENGAVKLVAWGAANGGSKRCKDTGLMRCKTPVGTFHIIELGGAGKRSDLYPLDCYDKQKCGHPMPFYFKFVNTGEGVHGNKWLVGNNASHGCVRIFTYDAKFLNKEFVFVGMPVIVEEY